MLPEEQLQWFGHVKRMNRTRTPRMTLQLDMQGKNLWDDEEHDNLAK